MVGSIKSSNVKLRSPTLRSREKARRLALVVSGMTVVALNKNWAKFLFPKTSLIVPFCIER